MLFSTTRFPLADAGFIFTLLAFPFTEGDLDRVSTLINSTKGMDLRIPSSVDRSATSPSPNVNAAMGVLAARRAASILSLMINVNQQTKKEGKIEYK